MAITTHLNHKESSVKNPFRKKHHETPVEFIEDEVKELKKEYGRFRRFSDENSLLIGTIVLGLAALVLINTLFWVMVTKQNDEARRQRDVAAVSQHVTTTLSDTKNSALSATVRNVSLKTDRDPAFTLADTEAIAIMDVTITNTSSKTQQLIPVNQFYVRTDEGDHAALHASMFATKPIAATDLAPNASATGQISFAVPKNAPNLYLYIDTRWDDTTPLVINVLK